MRGFEQRTGAGKNGELRAWPPAPRANDFYAEISRCSVPSTLKVDPSSTLYQGATRAIPAETLSAAARRDQSMPSQQLPDRARCRNRHTGLLTKQLSAQLLGTPRRMLFTQSHQSVRHGCRRALRATSRCSALIEKTQSTQLLIALNQLVPSLPAYPELLA